MQRIFPLPSLALSSAGVIVKLLHWSSWRCRRRSQLCSLLCSPNSCRDESCYPHPKGLGCENKENPRCCPRRGTAPHSSVWGLPAAHTAGHLGRPRLLPSLRAPHICMGNRTRPPPGSGVEKVEVERMKVEEVSARHTSVQRATRLRVVPLSVLPPSLLLLS